MAIIKGYNGKYPRIHQSVYLSENVSVIGDVDIGENSSVWFGAVIRGDVCGVKIGNNSNVQDNATIHVNHNLPTIIGDFVTIGHNAVVHAAEIGNYVIVGMGSVVLDGAKIGDNVIIAAGSVVPPRSEVPSNSLVMGVPAKVVKELNSEMVEHIKRNAIEYVELAKEMKKNLWI